MVAEGLDGYGYRYGHGVQTVGLKRIKRVSHKNIDFDEVKD